MEVVDVDLRSDVLGITTRFEFDPALQGDYAGLVLGNYEPVDADEPFALSAHIDLRDADGILEAYLLIREWVAGGEYVGQATRLAEIAADSPATIVVRTGCASGHVVQPALALRRVPGSAASGFIVIRQLIFGSLYKHPEWISS